MSKHTIYFKTVQEMNDYFPDGVPNNFLAIVNNGEDKTLLYTSSNNEQLGGPTEAQGGYNDSPETTKELSDATDKSEDILND